MLLAGLTGLAAASSGVGAGLGVFGMPLAVRPQAMGASAR
jgi:hypothetical protein